VKTRITAWYPAPLRAIARQLAAGVRADYADLLPSALALFRGRFRGVHRATEIAGHASALSLKMPMICSSVKLARFIRPSFVRSD
jgi:hypothetical protein